MRKRFACALLIGVLFSCLIRAPVKAAESTSTLTYKASSGGQAISGAEITLYKVADIFTDSEGKTSYVLEDAYKGILENASEEDVNKNPRGYAARISEVAVNPYESETTDEAGTCVFRNVPKGVYLVKETKKTGTASEYDNFEPSVLRIPELNEDGSENHDIEASLKFPPKKTESSTPSPTSTPAPTETPSPTKTPSKTGTPSPTGTPDSGSKDKDARSITGPKTGDDTPAAFYAAALGASAFALFLLKKHKHV